ncbi:type I methionyl aminopeptidase [Pedobacter sp. L105]|uniref:type I methionyl aminopeptidase n=1 Tax=Pedobacter sp. L105 TaxID=1641871 RepID=UPI00131BF2DE|nr:type I methionyl aminopeptidase [Pedobacter sp. L105]
MIIFKTEEEIELMKVSALLVSSTLTEIAKVLKAGMTTMQLDKLAHEFIKDHGAVPSFYHYNGYPFHICTSVNEVVVHGMPNQRPLLEGDVITVDIGVVKDGYHGDHAYTFMLGEMAPETIKLVKITKESLFIGIQEAIVGNHIGDISSAIQRYAEKEGYGVVRDLVGHGIGRTMHEDPQVPNFGRRGTGIQMRENLTLAIEPMINLGTKDLYTSRDGWTIKTADGKPAAHFEHDVCIKPETALILSDFSPIEAAEKANQNLNSSYYE